MEQVLYILFGWLLGLLAPALVERIRKNYPKAELTVAIKAELHELQYKMAFVWFGLANRLGALPDARLDWFEQIVRNYVGIQPVASVLDNLAGIRAVPERERLKSLAQTREPNSGIAFPQYSMPFISVHVSDLSLYTVPFQSAVLSIQNQLDVFNHRTKHLEKLHDRTFDETLSSLNRSIVLHDHERDCRDLAERAVSIADAIENVPEAK